MGRTLCVLIILGVLCGCERREPPPAADSGQDPWMLIVSPAWLHANSVGMLVVDTRSAEAYASGHIPGAIHLPASATYDSHPERSTEIAPIQTIEALFGAAGIAPELPVVLYDDTYRDAARVFWALELHGHPRVAVLSGGIAGWKAEGRPVSTEPVVPVPRRFVAILQPERMVSKLQVAQATHDPRLLILDARSRDEYVGAKPAGSRPGHIPTAKNTDASLTMATNGDGACGLLELDELRLLYADLDAEDRIITYCTTGTRASICYLALRAIGRDVAVYDGSWNEWSADPNLPVVLGAEPGEPLDLQPSR